jgi:hypothetical protein
VVRAEASVGWIIYCGRNHLMRIPFGQLKQVVRSGIGLALIVMALAAAAHAGGPFPTPEIDPGSMGSALTLLFGGAILLRRRVGRS